jgi:hypothetical protein
MNRRSFLSLLGMAGGALAFGLPAGVEAVTYDVARLQDIGPGAVNLQAITEEVLRLFLHELRGGPRLTPPPSDWCWRYNDVQQFGCAIRLDPDEEIHRLGHLHPLAWNLADRVVRDQRNTMFGAPPIPVGDFSMFHFVRAELDGASLRGARSYDVETNAFELRFDILGGRG